MKRGSDAIIGMDVDMGEDGKDRKDGEDGEDDLGASLGRYKPCVANHHACGICGQQMTGSHAWWYSKKTRKWCCQKCQDRLSELCSIPGWIDYNGKDGEKDCDKDKNTDGGGGGAGDGGAGDTEMCAS